MKLDKTSYYPKSLLDDEEVSEPVAEQGGDLTEKSHTVIIEREEILSEPLDEQGALDMIASLHEYPNNSLEKFTTGLSVFLSWVLVPLLMPVYGILLSFNLSILSFTPFMTKIVFVGIAAVLSIGIPGIIVFILKKMGIVNDIGLNGQKERMIPYVVLIICLGVTSWFMWYKGAPMWLVMFFAGGALGGFINMIINFWWKISAHAAGVAGIVALLVRILSDDYPHPATFYWLIASILLAGLLGGARVWLGRHTVWQVLGGYIVGFCSVFLLTLIR